MLQENIFSSNLFTAFKCPRQQRWAMASPHCAPSQLRDVWSIRIVFKSCGSSGGHFVYSLISHLSRETVKQKKKRNICELEANFVCFFVLEVAIFQSSNLGVGGRKLSKNILIFMESCRCFSPKCILVPLQQEPALLTQILFPWVSRLVPAVRRPISFQPPLLSPAPPPGWGVGQNWPCV